jgi:phenylalanyl-tRNA synthetase beta chain
MKISLNWLKEFIEITETPEELGQILTGTGLEVEDITKIDSITGGLEGFVVGEVLTCEPFEVKDKKLSLTTVDNGETEIATIVCGAPNVRAGQKVIVAKVGTTLYNKDGSEAFKIEKRKVYGHPSEGMICAEDEIGIGTSHDGILILETDLPNGTPAAKFFNIESDFVFEIGLTPNRADAASHFGVARDIKAFTNREIKLPSIANFSEVKAKSPIEVIIENVDGCPRFCGLSIANIKVGESPKWLKDRLKAIGLNPINNVVDITNYVNHELGQPLHAYDATEIEGNKIIVKTLAAGTKFTTLDKVERTLNDNDLMICNANEAVGIAGIFGGMKSGIKESTTDVFLEVAYFEPAFIRKTAQSHGLKTDASFRFERGTDPNLKVFALKRAASLIVEIAGGNIVSDIIDVYPKRIENQEILEKYSRINQLIGIEIEKNRINKILQSLDIEVVSVSDDEFKANVPAYRVDVTREADIVEEVLRIYGLNNVGISDYLGTTFISGFPAKDKNKLQIKLSNVLIGAGFSEILTNSLTKPTYHDAIRADLQNEDVEIVNKLSEDLGVMRQSLLFSGLEVLSYNINRRQKDLKLFDFGKVYSKSEKYKENNRLALFLAGNTNEETWQNKAESVSFHALAGEVNKVLAQMKVKSFEVNPIEQSQTFAYGLSYQLNKKEIAKIGLVQPKIAKLTEIKVPVFYADIDWDYLFKQFNDTATYQEISKFPEVRRDLSIVLNDFVTFDQIRKIAFKLESKLLKSVNVFDVYQGQNLGEGKKSYSVSFILQDAEQTLVDKKIDGIMDNFIRVFEKDLEATIRK